MTESIEWYLSYDSFSERFTVSTSRPETIQSGRIKVWGPLVSRKAAERKKAAVRKMWNTVTAFFSSQTSVDTYDPSTFVVHGFTIKLERDCQETLDFSPLLNRIRNLAVENCLQATVTATRRGYNVCLSLWRSSR